MSSMVAPLLHKNEYGAVPSLTVISISPSLSPLQIRSVMDAEASIETSVIDTVFDTKVFPFPSVTVTM